MPSSSSASCRWPSRPRSVDRQAVGRRTVTLPASDAWRTAISKRLGVCAIVAGAVVGRRSSRGWCTCRCSSTTTSPSAPSGSSMRTVEAPAKRADIVDRNGQLLAYSVEADTIYAVPTRDRRPAPGVRRAVPRAGRLHGEGSRRAGRSDPQGQGVRLRAPPGVARAGAAGGRAAARRRRLPEGEPALLPQQEPGGARARPRRHRQRRAGRHRGRLRLDHQGPARHRAHPRGRQAAGLQPHRAEADDRAPRSS